MGFRLAVSGGAENISLDERTIEKVSFGSDSAKCSIKWEQTEMTEHSD